MKLLICCLCLLVAGVTASQFTAELSQVVRYRGENFKVYTDIDKKFVEPYVAIDMRKDTPVKRSVLGNGYYVKLPLSIRSVSSLVKGSKSLTIDSVSVNLRSGFAPACGGQCGDVSASSVRNGRGVAIFLRCRTRSTCSRISAALAMKTSDSEVVRNMFKFKFFVRAKTAEFSYEKRHLPVYEGKRLRNAFYIDSSRILLFTVKAASGYRVHQTMRTRGHNRIPSGRTLPRIFRSDYLDQMSTLAKKSGKKTIVYEMRKSHRKVLQIKFDISKNTRSLTSTNWFSLTRVSSSYPYRLRTDSSSVFIERKYDPMRRYFTYGNRGIDGCQHDRWVTMISEKRDVCTWANKYWRGTPLLLYNTVNRGLNQDSMKSADRLLVYLE